MYYPLYYSQLVPQAGVEPAFEFLLLRETTLPICLPGQLVRETGLEPVCLSTGDFKSPMYTIPSLSQVGAPGRTRTDTH